MSADIVRLRADYNVLLSIRRGCVHMTTLLALLLHTHSLLAPPTLILDANHTLTVQFEDPDEPNLTHELLLTVTRPGSTNATRPALPGSLGRPSEPRQSASEQGCCHYVTRPICDVT